MVSFARGECHEKPCRVHSSRFPWLTNDWILKRLIKKTRLARVAVSPALWFPEPFAVFPGCPNVCCLERHYLSVASMQEQRTSTPERFCPRISAAFRYRTRRSALRGHQMHNLNCDTESPWLKGWDRCKNVRIVSWPPHFESCFSSPLPSHFRLRAPTIVSYFMEARPRVPDYAANASWMPPSGALVDSTSPTCNSQVLDSCTTGHSRSSAPSIPSLLHVHACMRYLSASASSCALIICPAPQILIRPREPDSVCARAYSYHSLADFAHPDSAWH
ncbi:hypothetical protein B0H16DRAFT_933592 [Mycena metata]|uniref:Uncharacterized protein n=1 Tax=Mycena metata TaxID=1033252 RepID=A0AAD7IN54_9AGAR|nr:hypothetical protein B0H16DRAFT_933592 [Mycena metata]